MVPKLEKHCLESWKIKKNNVFFLYPLFPCPFLIFQKLNIGHFFEFILSTKKSLPTDVNPLDECHLIGLFPLIWS